MFVLLPAVFQPQRSVIVRVQVLIGNGYHIRIRDPGITPEEKHIPCQYVRFTMRFNFHITDFLERFTAQCPWGFIRLLGQGEMLEMDFVCIAFLISQTAYFFQYGKVMSDSIYCITLILHSENLIVMDELFRKLPKC